MGIDFFIIGFLAYGGGVGMLSYIQKVAATKGWLNIEQFSDMIALSQITPGPIAINIATYVGYNVGGIVGSLVATIFLIIPSFILIFIGLKLLGKYIKSIYIQNIIEGFSVVSLSLILSATIPLLKTSIIINNKINYLGILLIFYSFYATYTKKNILITLSITALWGLLM